MHVDQLSVARDLRTALLKHQITVQIQARTPCPNTTVIEPDKGIFLFIHKIFCYLLVSWEVQHDLLVPGCLQSMVLMLESLAEWSQEQGKVSPPPLPSNVFFSSFANSILWSASELFTSWFSAGNCQMFWAARGIWFDRKGLRIQT